MTLTDNKEERLQKNEGSSMHDDSCIGINFAHRFPMCFRSGLFALHFVSPIQLLSLYQFIQFLSCTRIPCRDSHCENGLVKCCLYTTRRLQQTAVSCKRSICNKRKIVKVARLRFYPKTANNGSSRSIMSLSTLAHLWTFFELL